jgi:hypothetical protein
MKRFRLSTLMLLIVIAALIVALVVQDRRAARRELELRLRMESMAESYERIATQQVLSRIDSQYWDTESTPTKKRDGK